MVHAATSNKGDLNSLMMYEGSKYRELVEILGTQVGQKKQDQLVQELGHAQMLPVIRNAQLQMGID